jgi:hypothetical protein
VRMLFGLAPTWNPIDPKIFRGFEFSFKKLWPYERSPGTFLDFSTFNRKIFRFLTFEPEKFGRK